MPVVVDGIDLDGRVIEPSCGRDQADASNSESGKNLGHVLAAPVAEENESSGQSGKGESCPWKDWEKPGLRRAQVVDAIDIGLDGPWEPGGTPVGPQWRRQQRDRSHSCHRGRD